MHSRLKVAFLHLFEPFGALAVFKLGVRLLSVQKIQALACAYTYKVLKSVNCLTPLRTHAVYSIFKACTPTVPDKLEHVRLNSVYLRAYTHTQA